MSASWTWELESKEKVGLFQRRYSASATRIHICRCTSGAGAYGEEYWASILELELKEFGSRVLEHDLNVNHKEFEAVEKENEENFGQDHKTGWPGSFKKCWGVQHVRPGLEKKIGYSIFGSSIIDSRTSYPGRDILRRSIPGV
jgi:hypothetical protein